MWPVLAVVEPAPVGFSPWKFQFHPEVWFMMICLIGGWIYMVRVIGPKVVPPGQPVVSRRNLIAFLVAMPVLWVASDWPLHDISEDYLYSAHMLQHMALSYFVPPLVLIATPTWMARLVLGDGALYRATKWLTKPVVAAVLFNVVVLFTHIPVIVNTSVAEGPFHYSVHVLVFTSSLLMWGPVCGPIPEFRIGPAQTMAYLFVQSIVPSVPAGWLTFAEGPIYQVYDRPIRLWGLSITDDQQLAGAIMKTGGGIFLWTIIILLFAKRFAARHHTEYDYRRASRSASSPDANTGGSDGGGVLTTEDVEAAFAKSSPILEDEILDR